MDTPRGRDDGSSLQDADEAGADELSTESPEALSFFRAVARAPERTPLALPPEPHVFRLQTEDGDNPSGERSPLIKP